jgi:putative hydrolase of the HAD superfamily
LNSFKHFSFDLWLTLIKSNPEFKKKRALYFYKNFNSNKKSLSEVENAFRKIDLMCNSINEKTGGNIDSEEMYLMVIFDLNGDNYLFENIELKDIYTDLENIFFDYSPQIYNEYTIDVLNKLKQNQDLSMSILSNTAFIKGKTLRKLLNNINISQYFDFQIYSDEVNISKPNPEIYRRLIHEIYSVRKNNSLKYDEIIHVGDNINADFYGASNFGIQSLLINSNNYTIKYLYEIC